MDLNKLTKNQLFARCAELNIIKYKSKNKPDLIAMIRDKNAELAVVDDVAGAVVDDVAGAVVDDVADNVDNAVVDDVADVVDNPIAGAVDNARVYNFIEVCAGGGGLSSGLISAGFTPILLNDINKDCCETLRRNHPDVNVVCGSMDDIDYTRYIDAVDLFTGGVPCQSFSQAGLRKGLEDPRGDLMMKFANILNLVKPKVFMIENVKGLLTHDGGETITKIIDGLNAHDLYDIKYKCLDASKYNIPQKRERVFIVGVLKNLQRDFNFPNESVEVKLLRDVLIDVPASGGVNYSDEKKELFRMIPQGGCWINLPVNLQRQYLGNSYNSGGGKRGILYRLSMDKPSLTLLCTPSQKQTERCHPLLERPLTVREYARVQTFGDNYEFVGSINSCYKQIGNAVPVELARIMGTSIIDVLR